MDPTQRPRAVVESNTPRPLSMQVKQNRIPPSGYQIRPPGPPPGSPRYPTHNGAAGGPRLSGRPPPELQRLDSRSALSSPAGQLNQFVQQRPSFIPARSPITPATSSATFPRALLSPTNTSNQAPVRYSNSTAASNIRGPSYSTSGQRPPFYPQPFLRPQRPGPFETVGGVPLHSRFGAYPQATDNRHITPRLHSENRSAPQNDERAMKSLGAMAASVVDYTPQTAPSKSFDRMENIEKNKTLQLVGEEIDNKNEMSKHKQAFPTDSGENVENEDNDIDNDDDDVIMDIEKDSTFHSDHRSVAPNISDSVENLPPHYDTDVDSISEKRSNSKMGMNELSLINNQSPSKKQLSDAYVKNELNTLGLKTVDIDELTNDTNNLVDYVTRSSNNTVTRTPLPTSTTTSPNTIVASPRSTSLIPSPDSVSGVMGYDNGKLRSLSPKSNSSLSTSVSSSMNALTSPRITTIQEKPMNQQDPMNLSKNLSSLYAIDDVVAESIAIASTTKKTSRPSRTTTPKDPSMKPSPLEHPMESGDGDDNGTNSTLQSASLETNGIAVSPTKKSPTKSKENDKSKSTTSPVKSPTKSIKSLPRTPESGPPATVDKKKVPMNKVQVGAAPSPNLKTVRSKIGSLDNTSYKPGGGKVKIENRKLDFSKAQPKIAAKNDRYAPSGGDKKITQVKLQWNAKPKVGSLDNATYKPGGGDKKIETVKLDFKDKAKPKVGSKDNAKHVPGGGTVKSTVTPPKSPQELMEHIETQKIDIKAESKVGSMDNMKHKPGGGDKKIFNDRDYLRQTSSNVESINGSGAQSPAPSIDSKNGLPTSDENLNQEY